MCLPYRTILNVPVSAAAMIPRIVEVCWYHPNCILDATRLVGHLKLLLPAVNQRILGWFRELRVLKKIRTEQIFLVFCYLFLNHYLEYLFRWMAAPVGAVENTGDKYLSAAETRPHLVSKNFLVKLWTD